MKWSNETISVMSRNAHIKVLLLIAHFIKKFFTSSVKRFVIIYLAYALFIQLPLFQMVLSDQLKASILTCGDVQLKLSMTLWNSDSWKFPSYLKAIFVALVE